MTHWIRLLSITGLCWIAGSASAQVERRAFKLSVDTSLFGFIRSTQELDDATQEDTAFGFGPGGDSVGGTPGYVALGASYVAHPYVIAGLQIGLGVTRLKLSREVPGQASEDEEGPNVAQLMFRPLLEVPINPRSRIVAAAVIGLDYRRLKMTYEGTDGDDDTHITTRAIGPVLGVATHFFVIERASIDLGAQFVYQVLRGWQDYGDGSASDPTPDKYSALSVGLTLGLSLWPGPSNPPRS